MHELYKNIRRYRKLKGWTQEELANKMGYKDRSIISKVESGQLDLSRSKVEDFAKVFDTSPAILMGWTEIEKDESNLQKQSERIKAYYINLVGMSAAGRPIEAQENRIGELEVPYAWSNKDEYFGLQIKGDSMEPAICNNDIVIVHKQEDAESGEIVIASVGQNDATCKRLMKYGETILLRSYNQAYDDIDVTGDENFKIYGKVVESRRKYE